MPNHKKNPLDKKHPFNLSISANVIEAFEERCKLFEVSKNEIAEELFKDFLKD